MQRQNEIIGLGMAVLDIVMLLDQYPQNDEKQPAKEALSQVGGPCAAALCTASRLGVTAAYLGNFSQDVYSMPLREMLDEFGVDLSFTRIVAGHTPHSVVLLDESCGKRTVIWYGGSLPTLTADHIPDEALRGAKILHLDNHGMDAAIFAARRARDLGLLVSLDAGSAYQGCESLLPLVDILVPSEKFVRQYTGQNDIEKGALQLYQAYKPRLFAVTQGEVGGLMWQEDALVPYPAFPVTAVDSNGAGDVFHGALLAALVRGLEPRQAIRFASATSALKCMHLGTKRGIPTWEEAMALCNAPGSQNNN